MHAAPESFNNGCYVTLWPNTMLSVFAGFAATFRLTPSSPTTTIVEREYLWHPSVSDERRKADYEATRRVVEQDLEMCEAVQRTYAGGCSADGVLSTEHERGVAHLHRLLVASLDARRAERYAGEVPRAPHHHPVRRAASRPISAAWRSSTPRGRSCSNAASSNTRIADVADALGVSTGLIHYHFASKDDLLAATLRHAAESDILRLEKSVAASADPIARFDRVLREYLPSPRGDQTWLLWIDTWAAGLRNPVLREISEELDEAWVRVLEGVIVAGVDAGTFRCADPRASGVAHRVAARRPRPPGRPAQLDDEAQSDARARRAPRAPTSSASSVRSSPRPAADRGRPT